MRMNESDTLLLDEPKKRSSPLEIEGAIDIQHMGLQTCQLASILKPSWSEQAYNRPKPLPIERGGETPDNHLCTTKPTCAGEMKYRGNL
jgi:hypothetical protein